MSFSVSTLHGLLAFDYLLTSGPWDVGLSDYFVFTGYNNKWRKQRAYLKVPLSAPVVKRDYSALLEVKAREYLERCFVHPENFLAELNRCFRTRPYDGMSLSYILTSRALIGL